MLVPVSNIEKSILMNLKKLTQLFAYTLFKYPKKHTYKFYLEIPSTVFLHISFSNIKKSILTNPKITGTVFCLTSFQMLKKRIPINSKNLGTVFFSLSRLEILKKHTSVSQNTWHSFFEVPLF